MNDCRSCKVLLRTLCRSDCIKFRYHLLPKYLGASFLDQSLVFFSFWPDVFSRYSLLQLSAFLLSRSDYCFVDTRWVYSGLQKDSNGGTLLAHMNWFLQNTTGMRRNSPQDWVMSVSILSLVGRATWYQSLIVARSTFLEVINLLDNSVGRHLVAFMMDLYR